MDPRVFEVVLAIVASLALYEIAAIGASLSGAPDWTITHIVAGSDAAYLAATLSLAFGVGLAAHFVVERRNRQ